MASYKGKFLRKVFCRRDEVGRAEAAERVTEGPGALEHPARHAGPIQS
jgi:hypothetical protein